MFFANYSATFGYGTGTIFSIMGNQAKLRRTLIVSVYLLVLH